MHEWHRGWMTAAGAVAVLAGLALTATSGFAAGGYTEGSFGYDVSWPQCGTALPSDPGFAIVGVTGGKSLSGNPCLAEQAEWALSGDQAPALYINTNGAPKGYSTRLCARKDTGCVNEQYGFEAATWAVDYASRNGAENLQRYWLDVETMNSWSRDKTANARAIKGFIRGLESAGKSVMGIYSTSYQWGTIAGTYAPGLDNWVPRPGIVWPGGASAACANTPSFAGGSVVMIQVWNAFDENYVCPQ